MTIKKATLIALYGNAAVLFFEILESLSVIHLSFSPFCRLLVTLARYGTLVLFLYTLYRKQP